MGRIRGYDTRYAKYLATPDYGTFEVHCIELRHPTFTTRRLQNRIPGDFVAVDEDSKARTYRPTAFEVSLPSVAAGTMQKLLINVDAMDGDLYIALRGMALEARFADPIILKYRIYLNTLTSAPLINPPGVYQLHRVRPSAEKLICEARALGLGDIPAGELYTAERFPILGIRQ